MAKIVGFGQTGFVARMQKQSLFGYEPYGQMEGTYSPYAFSGYGVASGAEQVNQALKNAGYTCPDGTTLYVDANGNPKCAINYGQPNQMDADPIPASQPSDPPVTPGNNLPPPPPSMAASCSQALVWDGSSWSCPDKPTVNTSPTLGLTEQVRLALVNRARGGLTPSNYGMDGTNDTDGVWGSRSKSAWSSYAASRGLAGQATSVILATLVAETSSSPVWRDQAAMNDLLRRIKGAASPPPPPPPPPAVCPDGTTGTYPNCKPKGNLANVLVGSALLAAAVGMLALAARNRDE